jgi:hypothetical protein
LRSQGSVQRAFSPMEKEIVNKIVEIIKYWKKCKNNYNIDLAESRGQNKE